MAEASAGVGLVHRRRRPSPLVLSRPSRSPPSRGRVAAVENIFVDGGRVAEEEDGAGGGKGDRGRERKRGKEGNDEKDHSLLCAALHGLEDSSTRDGRALGALSEERGSGTGAAPTSHRSTVSQHRNRRRAVFPSFRSNRASGEPFLFLSSGNQGGTFESQCMGPIRLQTEARRSSPLRERVRRRWLVVAAWRIGQPPSPPLLTLHFSSPRPPPPNKKTPPLSPPKNTSSPKQALREELRESLRQGGAALEDSAFLRQQLSRLLAERSSERAEAAAVAREAEFLRLERDLLLREGGGGGGDNGGGRASSPGGGGGLIGGGAGAAAAAAGTRPPERRTEGSAEGAGEDAAARRRRSGTEAEVAACAARAGDLALAPRAAERSRASELEPGGPRAAAREAALRRRAEAAEAELREAREALCCAVEALAAAAEASAERGGTESWEGGEEEGENGGGAAEGGGGGSPPPPSRAPPRSPSPAPPLSPLRPKQLPSPSPPPAEASSASLEAKAAAAAGSSGRFAGWRRRKSGGSFGN